MKNGVVKLVLLGGAVASIIYFFFWSKDSGSNSNGNLEKDEPKKTGSIRQSAKDLTRDGNRTRVVRDTERTFGQDDFHPSNKADFIIVWEKIDRQDLPEDRKLALRYELILQFSKNNLDGCLDALVSVAGPGTDRGKYLKYAISRSGAALPDVVYAVNNRLTFDDDLNGVGSEITRIASWKFDPSEIASLLTSKGLKGQVKKDLESSVGLWFSQRVGRKKEGQSIPKLFAQVEVAFGDYPLADRKSRLQEIVKHSIAYDPFGISALVRDQPDFHTPQIKTKLVSQMAIKDPHRALQFIVDNPSLMPPSYLTNGLKIWLGKDSASAAGWFNENSSAITAEQHDAAVKSFEELAIRHGDVEGAEAWRGQYKLKKH